MQTDVQHQHQKPLLFVSCFRSNFNDSTSCSVANGTATVIAVGGLRDFPIYGRLAGKQSLQQPDLSEVIILWH